MNQTLVYAISPLKVKIDVWQTSAPLVKLKRKLYI